MAAAQVARQGRVVADCESVAVLAAIVLSQRHHLERGAAGRQLDGAIGRQPGKGRQAGEGAVGPGREDHLRWRFGGDGIRPREGHGLTAPRIETRQLVALGSEPDEHIPSRRLERPSQAGTAALQGGLLALGDGQVVELVNAAPIRGEAQRLLTAPAGIDVVPWVVGEEGYGALLEERQIDLARAPYAHRHPATGADVESDEVAAGGGVPQFGQAAILAPATETRASGFDVAYVPDTALPIGACKAGPRPDGEAPLPPAGEIEGEQLRVVAVRLSVDAGIHQGFVVEPVETAGEHARAHRPRSHQTGIGQLGHRNGGWPGHPGESAAVGRDRGAAGQTAAVGQQFGLIAPGGPHLGPLAQRLSEGFPLLTEIGSGGSAPGSREVAEKPPCVVGAEGRTQGAKPVPGHQVLDEAGPEQVAGLTSRPRSVGAQRGVAEVRPRPLEREAGQQAPDPSVVEPTPAAAERRLDPGCDPLHKPAGGNGATVSPNSPTRSGDGAPRGRWV